MSDSKWLWINMATMHDNLYGNCVGGVDLTFHVRAFVFFFTIAN
jgi:hypothetical protein